MAEEVNWLVVNGIVHQAFFETKTGEARACCLSDELGFIARKRRSVDKAPKTLRLCPKCACGEVEIIADAKTLLASA